MHIEHWMIFGTFAEQNYFIYPDKNTYDGVILNANMVTHAPAGLAAFLLSKTKDVSYIIDPLTHAFQHPIGVIQNDQGEVKSSIRSLSEIYGHPIIDYVGARPIIPKDLSAVDIRTEFVAKCLEFQKNYLKIKIEESDDSKYLEVDGINFSPKFLIAPYFYMTENSFEPWLEIQIELLMEAIKIKNDSKVYAELVIDKGILQSQECLKKLTEQYSSIGNDGFVLWIDDFNENEASQSELENLKSLVVGLSKAGSKKVINLHGGYFSIALSGIQQGKGLTGIAHSPEYGEYRAVVPVGGGIPISKFYIPKLHQRYKFREALQILRAVGFLDSVQSYHSNVCDCTKCKQLIEDSTDNFIRFGETNKKSFERNNGIIRMEFPTTESKENCLSHYLQVKRKEFLFAESNKSETIIAELENGIRTFQEVAGVDAVSHLINWCEILQG